MRKLLVIMLVSSLILTQCYTTNQYLTKDYKFSEEDDLKKIVLADSTVRELPRPYYNYQIESDCIIISHRIKGEKIGEHRRWLTISDTLSFKDIHSVYLSEFDSGSTYLLTFLGVGLVIAFKYTPIGMLLDR